jgi:hypothetical protein
MLPALTYFPRASETQSFLWAYERRMHLELRRSASYDDPRQRKVMLMVLLAGVIITTALPASFVAVMAASLVTIAVLGIADLLKRA